MWFSAPHVQVASKEPKMLSRPALLALLIPILFLAGCGKDKSYRLVSEKYNFSVEFPEMPTEQTKTNDEGLPKTYWEVSHDRVAAKDYFTAEATSYKEILNPDEELVPNEGLLALNGVKMVEHKRFKLKARETGREVDAMQTLSKETSTGVIISSIYVVDGHNMVNVTARMNDDAGKATLYLSTLTVLR
jgi:hypothetical protein